MTRGSSYNSSFACVVLHLAPKINSSNHNSFLRLVENPMAHRLSRQPINIFAFSFFTRNASKPIFLKNPSKNRYTY